MHEVLVNCIGGLSLPRKSVVRLTDRPDMALDVYRGRKQQCNNNKIFFYLPLLFFALTTPCRIVFAKPEDLGYFQEKNHYFIPFIYGPIFMLLHTILNHDNILNKFEFKHSRAKVKFTRKQNIVITLALTVLADFDVILRKW